jgi:hypothetical protein
VTNSAFSAVEVRCHLEQTRWLTAAAAQPAAECIPSDIGTFTVTETNQIDKASFGRIQPQSKAVAGIDFLAPEVASSRQVE